MRSLERERGCTVAGAHRGSRHCSAWSSPLWKSVSLLSSVELHSPAAFGASLTSCPTSCSGVAAGVAFHLSERSKEYAVYQWFVHVYMSMKQ